ncbi:MAG: DUF4147 domain-containing protein [Planctomycetaceae bacterium]
MAAAPVLRTDAAAAWRAAIAAVDPARLVAALPDAWLQPPGGRVVVVGGGKAAAGMAAGVARRLTGAGVAPDRLGGLVSVPEGCVVSVPGVEVRATRPAAANLPTAAVVSATEEILALVAACAPDDLVVAVITGGGSACLAAPCDGISLDDKVAVARFLAAAGADIAELNAVRRASSRVKAGGLARATRAGRLEALVLSDILGDPLDLIASGPCMPSPPDPRLARDILDRRGAVAAGVAPGLVASLVARLAPDRAGAGPPAPATPRAAEWITPAGCRVAHRIVGNNATAVAAAVAALEALGYDVAARGGALPEEADSFGRRLAAEAAALARRAAALGRPLAIVEGGEATVRVPDDHGRGGRNQQTVLAAIAAASAAGGWPAGAALASIGTDGEDGPTDAAGAVADAAVARAAAADPARLRQALARRDALPILEAAGGLVRTGPTGTNVADVRIVVARP